MRSIFSIVGVIFVSLAIISKAYGLPGESIVFDPTSGNYVVNYLGLDDSGDSDVPTIPRQAIFVPATKIYPIVGSVFKLRETEVVYSYHLSNGSNSPQSLISFIIDPASDIVSSSPLPKRRQDIAISAIEQLDKIGRAALSTPRNWDGIVWTSDAGGLRIAWGYSLLKTPSAGLIAGSSQDGFGFSSKDIPGIGVAQFRGRTPVFGFVDEGPIGEIKNQLRNLRQNNFVPRNIAVPTIAVPVPFDAAVLLDSIRAEVATWPAKQLLDPAYAAQLDRYLAAAADGYRHKQTKTCKEHAENLRQMLAKEHHFLDHDDEDNEDTEEHKRATRFTIDRLAARVLDFDLRYVLNRMERVEEEHKKR